MSKKKPLGFPLLPINLSRIKSLPSFLLFQLSSTDIHLNSNTTYLY
uniref:Uncharacterized protein n=1 Tax=Arundo donax TaxID=35708 RepID=A0A0A9A5H6_ARUDO